MIHLGSNTNQLKLQNEEDISTIMTFLGRIEELIQKDINEERAIRWLNTK
jgi:hypothetical protein